MLALLTQDGGIKLEGFSIEAGAVSTLSLYDNLQKKWGRARPYSLSYVAALSLDAFLGKKTAPQSMNPAHC